jgi:ribosomal-protein-alanine N-acetyltransferase
LRPWLPEDVDAIIAAFDDPDIQHWQRRRVDTHDEALQWVRTWARRWQANTDASWAITRPGSDEPVGYAALRSLMTSAATAQVSYWVLPAARRRRLAVRATQAVTRWAFDSLRLHRVYLMHSTANTASCGVARASGFAMEGTLREYVLHADGWHDVHLHARLAADS